MIKEFYDYLNENEIIKLIKIILQDSKITIFEFLNSIHRENIITKHLNSNIDNDNFRKGFNNNKLNKINIFEQDKLSIDPIFKSVIELHKTIPKKAQEIIEGKNDINNKESDKIFFSEYYEKEEEKRRKIIKNENGFFNYLPIPCKDHILVEINDHCIYYHNENEYKYHPLVYKTLFCSKNCLNKSTCENAHSVDEFRKIYEMNQKKDFTKFVRKIEKYLSKKNVLRNYLDYVEIPIRFSLDTFKVHPCKFKASCNIDPHLCYFYHSEYERRRCPKLFSIENEQCENCFINYNDSNNKECREVI